MLVGLLRTVFYILVFYYIFKFIGRFLMPIFLKKGFERMQQQQNNQANTFREKAKQQEGKVTVQKTSQTKKDSPVDDNQGEYIDYEEVK